MEEIEKAQMIEEYRYFLKRLFTGEIRDKYTVDFIEDIGNIQKTESIDCFIGYLKTTGCFDWKEDNENYEDELYDVLYNVDFIEIKRKFLGKKCRYIEILESFGFDVNTQNKTLNMHTPLGEDWWIDFDFDNIDNAIESLKNNIEYAIDDETQMYVENKGKSGIPNDMWELLEDGDWKKEELRKVIKKLEEIK
jgi:hypothetical protein